MESWRRRSTMAVLLRIVSRSLALISLFLLVVKRWLFIILFIVLKLHGSLFLIKRRFHLVVISPSLRLPVIRRSFLLLFLVGKSKLRFLPPIWMMVILMMVVIPQFIKSFTFRFHSLVTRRKTRVTLLPLLFIMAR